MRQITAKIGTTKYLTTLSSDAHKIIGDEPLPHGKDLGPNPFDFLLMALGSCVVMTLRMYADRKKWDLQEVEVQLSQNRVHAEDCEDCESEEGFVHAIEKKIKLIGDLDETQRERLMEIAERCPVNKTLLNEIKITSSVLA